MIVLDASAVLELLLSTRKGRVVAEKIAAPSFSLCAPHLIDLEVAQVLRRYVRNRAINDLRGRQALRDLAELDLIRYSHEPLLPRIWAMRDHLTAYDAAYIALAEVLGARLFTCDAKLTTAPGHRARVELID